jgi:hypothetical protein
MNDICEIWSLPWHALQRKLALALVRSAVGHSTSSLKFLSVQSVALSANSWLSRARHQVAPPPVFLNRLPP